MMTKLFYIGCIILFIQNTVCGQTAHATVTATITTPVGAEISNDINFEKFSKINKTQVSDNRLASAQNETPPFLKIIGDTFVHDVTIENDTVQIKRKKDSNGNRPPERIQPSLNITVNFN